MGTLSAAMVKPDASSDRPVRTPCKIIGCLANRRIKLIMFCGLPAARALELQAYGNAVKPQLGPAFLRLKDADMPFLHATAYEI
jgi:hypothetical protein